MSDVARYYHSSLYAFNAQARSAVIGTFNEVIQDVAVRSWYDGAQEIFLLECPNTLGSMADDALTTIIMKYIEQELDDAENEERRPNILRFPESRFDALDSFAEQRQEDEEDLTMSAPLVSGRPSVTHLVIVGPAEGKMLRFFRLDELAGDLLERTLAPFNERAQRVVNDGLTCRAVRWIEETGRYAFNGRTGTGRISLETAGENQLALPRFERLHDTRTFDADANNSAARTWAHVGEAPTVEKWVQGIGETRQEDPAEKADMPKDARNLIAATDSYAIGRVRVPKGAQALDDDPADSETSADERPPTGAFNNLLKGQMGSIDGSGDDSDSDEAEEPAFADLLGSNSSKQVAASMRRSFSGDWGLLSSPEARLTAWTNARPAGVMPTRRPQRDTPQRPPSSTQQLENFPPLELNLRPCQQTPSPVKQPLIEQSPQSQRLPRQRAVTRASQDTALRQRKVSARDDNSSFPDYGKDFSGVDRKGLHAPAAALAKWEIENYTEQKPKSKRQQVLLRQREISGSGFSPAPTDRSDFGNRESQTGTRGSRADSGVCASEDTLVNTPAQAEPEWVNNVVQPRVQTVRLVEERSRSSDRLPEAPPGFLAPRVPRIKPDQVSASPGVKESDGQLIDVEPNVLEDVPSQPPASIFANMQNPLVPTSSESTSQARQERPTGDGGSQDVIVERVQTLPANYTLKRNTMRQKATKKHKSKNTLKGGAKSAAKKVELPLPSPPPPPKPKLAPLPQTSEQKPRIKTTQAEEHGGAPNISKAPPSSSIVSESHAFGQALLDIRQLSMLKAQSADAESDTAQPLETVKLACQIGIVLLRGLDKSLRQRTNEPEVLQHKLSATSTDFKRDLFSRVTTSNNDAKALIALMSKSDGDFVTDVFYDVIIRDDTGAFLTITIPSADKESYTIKSQDQILTEACAHFPTRVWDVKYAILRPASEGDTPASKAVKEFVASMKSAEDAPSFRAMVSIGVFTLERVLAKRVFHQTADGITTKVVQVQDLFMEPADHEHHNIQVIALSEERMAEEQRLWWEASWETTDVMAAEELESRVNQVVCSMDHVGLENQGPWVRMEESDEGERPIVPADAILW